MNSGLEFLVEDGRYGPKVTLLTSWSDDIEAQLATIEVSELELNSARGWIRSSLQFLSSFPSLKALTIIDFRLSDLEPIHCLHSLKALQISTYCKSEIRFSAFPELESCGLEWRPKAKSVFDCTSLKSLAINRYSGKDTALFSRLKELINLSILSSPLTSLSGLRELLNLRSLSLASLRKLTSLDGLDCLSQLEDLWLQSCSHIRSIELLKSMRLLRRLQLDNCGSIQSLSPLRGLPNLNYLSFFDSTNIADGELGHILTLPKLEFVGFQNRRHYSHSRDEICKLMNLN